jgi:hypothetical protein
MATQSAPHPLDGANAKLARADTHLHAFEQAVLRYLAAEPVKVDTHDELREDGLRRIVWVASALQDPPEILGLLIGDWANSCRAALDYVVYELVRRESGEGDPRWTQFPVVTRRRDYASREARQLRGAPAWARTVIAGLQPFEDGEDPDFHPLAILAAISNRDKHRLIHAAAMQVAGSQARLSGTNLTEIHSIEQNPGTVTTDRVILDAVLKTDGNDFAIEMNLRVSVALEDYEFPAVDLLYGIQTEVAAIVEWFVPAFD